MTVRLSGKVAVVTAAAAGIGRAIAERLAREGASVHATDREPGARYETAGISVATLDVTDGAAVTALAAAIGPVDILVNAAGIVPHGSVLEATEAEWDRTFDINVKGMHRTVQAFLPGMLERAEAQQSSGSIINIASCASSLKGIPNRYVYGATKGAVLGLTKAVAVDFVARRIRCNAICPGPVRTPSWSGRVEAFATALGSVEQALDVYLSRQPMGRVGEADEIAALAAYLAADESAFMTGGIIPIDGGLSL
jgi:2-keto-3-deoxy-L-fuconate dehydrogenase